GGGVDRHLTGDEEQLPRPNCRRVGGDRLRRVGAGDSLLHAYAALTTFFDRRHRVQTRIRLLPPLMTARTDCRFGSNRRALTLFAWLCCRPTTGPFPQSSHRFAIYSSQLSAIAFSPHQYRLSV